MSKISFSEYVKNRLDSQKRNAGLGGEHHDGGYRRGMAVLEAYECGKAGYHLSMVPEFLPFVNGWNKESDPDYDEYVRLHKKFG